MQRPARHGGMRHVALEVQDLGACETFYVDLLGLAVEWRPDADNVYLTSGVDNVALHRGRAAPEGPQRLDHIGFVLARPEDVDDWHAWLVAHGVPMRSAPRTHRDGARSFYCEDPAGNVVQFIFHPPLASVAAASVTT